MAGVSRYRNQVCDLNTKYTLDASEPADAKTLGMLVVESTLPGSPAHGVLETGDVLVRMDGSIVTHFQQMAEILDDAVSAGAVVRLELERLGVMVGEG